MLRRRESTRLAAPDQLDGPTYDDLKVRSVVVAYVVSEGHHDETIFSLALKFSPAPDSDAVERAVRDLVAEELLTIEGGKVVAGRTWHSDLMVP